MRQSAGNDCGPAALAHCLRRLGVDAPYPDPASELRPGRRGCRLDEIAAEAARRGWPARARRADRRRLRSLRPPAILHVDGDHFVVLEGREPSGWVLHDPARGRQLCSAHGLRARWTGWVLEFVPLPGSRAGDVGGAAPRC